jgi:hypothetical protein
MDDDGRTFREGWLAKYGLRISGRADSNGAVSELACCFCETFGREDDSNDNGKRKRAVKPRTFGTPWRIDHIKRHCLQSHRTQLAIYATLESKERKVHFNSTNTCTTMPVGTASTSSSKKRGVTYKLDDPIVDVVVARLLLDLEASLAEASDNIDDDNNSSDGDNDDNDLDHNDDDDDNNVDNDNDNSSKYNDGDDENSDSTTETNKLGDIEGNIEKSNNTNGVFFQSANSSITRALSLFQRNEGLNNQTYALFIPSARLFRLIVAFVSAGLSFRQCTMIIPAVKEEYGSDDIGNVRRVMVTRYV